MRRRKCRPRRGLRVARDRTQIFFENPESGQKDGHSGAHRRGDKRVLTGESGSREWGVVEEKRELKDREEKKNPEESEEGRGTRRVQKSQHRGTETMRRGTRRSRRRAEVRILC